MGRFETAADFYQYREPYPASFFSHVSEQLSLTKTTRTLDVACGPGNLAIGFAPFVGTCCGIDIEPAMLRVARQAAVEAGANIEFIQVAMEDFKEADACFDFITIGRALHWLPREATLTVWEQIAAPGCRIAVCGAAPSDDSINTWAEKFRDLRRKWSGDQDEARYRPDLDVWFSGSRFRRVANLAVKERQQLTVEELVGRGLSFSVTSPAALGDRRAEFEAELRAAMEPFAVNGVIEEEVVASASVFGSD